MNKEKRIPTILGLVLLVASTFIGVQLTSSTKILNTKASGDCRPENIQVTNISYQSVNISFQTTDACEASINNNELIIQDSVSQKSKLHYFQLSNLKENTTYKYSIISGGADFSQDTYQFKTSTKPTKSIPSANLAWGRVTDAQGNPAAGSILFLNIPGSSPLSALVTSSGNWNISLASSFNLNLTDWFVPGDGIEEEIIVLAADIDPTVIQANTSRNNPVPDITLGQNYFSENTTNTTNSGQMGNLNFLAELTPIPSVKKLSITYPAQGEQITSLKPELLGSGPANSKITISISNFDITYDVSTDALGNWRWTPPQGLLPGSNTVSLNYQDQKLSRTFTVSTNTGLAFESSNSAIPTASPTVYIPASTSTPVPTIRINPTSTPVPTSTPKPIIRTSRPSTESGVPVSGVESVTIVIIAASFVLFITSLLLFKKSVNFK